MATNTLQENKMGVMPIGKLLVNMALPMIISMPGIWAITPFRSWR